MNDLRTLRDEIGLDWVRKAHVIAENDAALDAFEVPAHATVKRYKDALRVWHLEAAWPLRDVVFVPHPSFAKATCPYALYWVGKDKVSLAMVEAGVLFAMKTGLEPQVAYIRRIPASASEFVEVRGIALVQADWVLDGFIAVTRGGLWQGLPQIGVAHA